MLLCGAACSDSHPLLRLLDRKAPIRETFNGLLENDFKWEELRELLGRNPRRSLACDSETTFYKILDFAWKGKWKITPEQCENLPLERLAVVIFQCRMLGDEDSADKIFEERFDRLVDREINKMSLGCWHQFMNFSVDKKAQMVREKLVGSEADSFDFFYSSYKCSIMEFLNLKFYNWVKYFSVPLDVIFTGFFYHDSSILKQLSFQELSPAVKRGLIKGRKMRAQEKNPTKSDIIDAVNFILIFELSEEEAQKVFRNAEERYKLCDFKMIWTAVDFSAEVTLSEIKFVYEYTQKPEHLEQVILMLESWFLAYPEVSIETIIREILRSLQVLEILFSKENLKIASQSKNFKLIKEMLRQTIEYYELCDKNPSSHWIFCLK